jgi:hypothetical protein
MTKPSPDHKPANAPPADDAALCEHELAARRENEMRAKRKRDIESRDPSGDQADN